MQIPWPIDSPRQKLQLGLHFFPRRCATLFSNPNFISVIKIYITATKHGTSSFSTLYFHRSDAATRHGMNPKPYTHTHTHTHPIAPPCRPTPDPTRAPSYSCRVCLLPSYGTLRRPQDYDSCLWTLIALWSNRNCSCNITSSIRSSSSIRGRSSSSLSGQKEQSKRHTASCPVSRSLASHHRRLLISSSISSMLIPVR